MSEKENDIEALIRSAFKSMKSGGTEAPHLRRLSKDDTAASFGADLHPPNDLPEAKAVPTTSAEISEEADSMGPFFKGPPPLEDFLTLTSSVALLLGAFVALNTAHTKEATQEERDRLYHTAQRLCNRAVRVLKNLKTVQFAVSTPNRKGHLIVQVTHKTEKKD